MNPLLQDPGLAFHPPFLYLGYVGFSMAFSFAVAALLIEGRVDAAWARWVRPWTLAAWTALTLGIAMGSWWAYYELGWGGWWFWDPVENASFMPWLAGTALLHSAIVCEKRNALKSWTILLAIIAFSLSLLGTFLVRSGVLTSVHAFATDPARGVYILALLVIAIGGSLALYAWRAPSLKAEGLFAPISREGALILNNLLLATACFTVFLGTLYPLFLDTLGGGTVSVGPPYFEITFIPLMVPLIIATGIGPLLAWKRGDLKGALVRLKFVAAVALVAWAVLWWTMTGTSPLPAFGIALAVWLAGSVLVELAGRLGIGRVSPSESWRRATNLPRAAYGMTSAHLGLAVFVAGVTASTAWQSEVITAMRPGDTQDVAGYTFTLENVADVPGPNYLAERAVFTLSMDGRELGTMTPEKRFYPVQGTQTTEAAIRTTFLADLYAVIGDPVASDPGAFAVRLYHNPLVPWIWGGTLFMVFGGLVSLTDTASPGRRACPAQDRRGAAGMTGHLQRLLLVLTMIVVMAPGAVAVQPDEILDDPALEARARAITAELPMPGLPEPSRSTIRMRRWRATCAFSCAIVCWPATATRRSSTMSSIATVITCCCARRSVRRLGYCGWATFVVLAIAIGLLAIVIRRHRLTRQPPPAPLSDEERARLDIMMRNKTS